MRIIALVMEEECLVRKYERVGFSPLAIALLARAAIVASRKRVVAEELRCVHYSGR